MSLIDLFKDLHIEHESFPIVKERLGLIQDKFAKCERELEESIAANLVLRDENMKLKAEKATLQTENANLKDRLQNIPDGNKRAESWSPFDG